jgi:hypothetical protein
VPAGHTQAVRRPIAIKQELVHAEHHPQLAATVMPPLTCFGAFCRWASASLLSAACLLAPAWAHAQGAASTPEAYRFYIDDYDPDSGLYFTGLGNQLYPPRLNNVYVYDPTRRAGRNLFVRSPERITAVLIEVGHDRDLREMAFIGARDRLKNNRFMEPRRVSPVIVIETTEEATRKSTVWLARKSGGEPEAVFSYVPPASWHLDVRGRVIRLVTPVTGTLSVNEYPWQ